MRIKKGMGTLFFTLFILISGGAQDVRASLSSREGYVGLPLDYQITLTGSKKAEVPELAGFDGFEVRYKGQTHSSQTSIINGERRSTVTMRYGWELIPLREGTWTIPSVSIEVDGTIYETPEAVVTILPPREMDGFRLILIPEDEKVYMGQTVTVDMEFHVTSEVGGLNFTLPGQGEGSREGVDFRILESTPPDQSSHDIRQIPVGNRIFYGYVSSRFEGGEQYTVLTIPLDVMPLRSGTLTLEGAAVAFSTQSGSWPRTKTENHVIPSESCTLQADQLPREIRESGNGILLSRGEMKATAQLSSQEARPGDPLTLQVELSGLVHPELCEIPDLETFSSLEDSFSLPADRSRPQAEEDRLTITQTIRPVSVETKGVPPLTFVYFDLEREDVKQVSTEFLPLSMSSAGDLSLSDVESFGGGEDRVRLQENDRGIRHNKSLDQLLAGDRRGTALLASPLFRVILIFPPLLFLITLLVLALNSFLRHRRLRAEKNPLVQFNKSLDRGGDSYACFEGYLRHRLFRGKSFQREELKAKGESLGLPELFTLYEQLEMNRYAGGSGEEDSGRVRQMVEEVEKAL
ncbi:MAG: BatD family protein [Spirochaetales bacterium]|nr:BatD family protein [Spirochaetales bacterium]